MAVNCNIIISVFGINDSTTWSSASVDEKFTGHCSTLVEVLLDTLFDSLNIINVIAYSTMQLDINYKH